MFHNGAIWLDLVGLTWIKLDFSTLDQMNRDGLRNRFEPPLPQWFPPSAVPLQTRRRGKAVSI
jgi:hypothetical protein